MASFVQAAKSKWQHILNDRTFQNLARPQEVADEVSRVLALAQQAVLEQLQSQSSLPLDQSLLDPQLREVGWLYNASEQTSSPSALSTVSPRRSDDFFSIIERLPQHKHDLLDIFNRPRLAAPSPAAPDAGQPGQDDTFRSFTDTYGPWPVDACDSLQLRRRFKEEFADPLVALSEQGGVAYLQKGQRIELRLNAPHIIAPHGDPQTARIACKGTYSSQSTLTDGQYKRDSMQVRKAAADSPSLAVASALYGALDSHAFFYDKLPLVLSTTAVSPNFPAFYNNLLANSAQELQHLLQRYHELCESGNVWCVVFTLETGPAASKVARAIQQSGTVEYIDTHAIIENHYRPDLKMAIIDNRHHHQAAYMLVPRSHPQSYQWAPGTSSARINAMEFMRKFGSPTAGCESLYTLPEVLEAIRCCSSWFGLLKVFPGPSDTGTLVT